MYTSSFVRHAAACVLPFVLSTAAISPLVARASEDAGVLLPIHADSFDRATGIQPRDATDFSRLDLQTQSQLIYGRPGDNGQLLFANMTLYAPDGKKIVLMERFEGLTTALDCKGDDGEMSLTFKSKDAFDYAAKQWAWINEGDEDSFILIANHDGCGPADERQPYLITGTDQDEATLTTRLTAKISAWSEVAGTYDLDFGHLQQAPNARRRQRRQDILSEIGEGINEVVDEGIDEVKDTFESQGNAKMDESVTFDVTAGTPGEKTNILTDINTPPRLVIDCINCYVKGSFVVTGHVSVENFEAKDVRIEACPKKFEAVLELQTTIRDKIVNGPAIPPLSLSKELLAFPIPNAGIAVANIFKLGAVVAYEVGVNSTLNGVATFTYGLNAKIPDTAVVSADLLNKDKSTATGFEGTTMEPLFNLDAISTNVRIAALSQPKLTFGIDILKVGKIEAGLMIKVPEVALTLAATFNDTGVCTKEKGASRTGVELTSTVAVQVDIEVTAELGPISPNFTKKLWGILHPFFKKCIPIEIPGLDAVSAKTAAPLLGSNEPPKTVKHRSVEPPRRLDQRASRRRGRRGILHPFSS
ncbi:MAG: hypothetical protein M1837_000227 [Sclerophora amabilis]|nr:MAG: hypothetical protein M1837_000227 [Sclerophora amabilis]